MRIGHVRRISQTLKWWRARSRHREALDKAHLSAWVMWAYREQGVSPGDHRALEFQTITDFPAFECRVFDALRARDERQRQLKARPVEVNSERERRGYVDHGRKYAKGAVII